MAPTYDPLADFFAKMNARYNRNRSPTLALFGYSRIHINPRVLRWIGA